MTKKLIHEVLDIDAEPEEHENLTDVQHENLPTVQPQVGGAVIEPMDAEEQELQRDFEEARRNIADALEIAVEAAEKAAQIASDTEDDKDFQALNGLLKTIIDGNEKKVNIFSAKMAYIEKKRKVYMPDTGGNAKVYIDKAVFTGTLEQTLDALKNEKKDEE
jgi:Zn-dependent M32 family carboxypeptidase